MSDAPQVQDRSLVDDENLWLEEIHDERALAWVEEQNQRTLSAFDAAALATTTRQILDVLDSTDRIPRLSKYGPYFYNFWKDAEHPRGLWRRTTLDSYRTPAPDWDVLLDVDELGRREKTEWVFAGVR
jgi:prolyl oligopeptidase